MTPDEQPQPVAWLHTVVNGDDNEMDQALSFAPDNFPLQGTFGYRSIAVKPLYAHPPTSAASQPEAVKVTDEMVGLAHDQLLREDEDVDEAAMRRILEAVLNPPAESAARGDVPDATPTSGGGS